LAAALDHASGLWIGPERSIPLAEEIGQMSRLSEWLTRKTIAQGPIGLTRCNSPSSHVEFDARI